MLIYRGEYIVFFSEPIHYPSHSSSSLCFPIHRCIHAFFVFLSVSRLCSEVQFLVFMYFIPGFYMWLQRR